MTIRHIRIFLAVCENGNNLTRAAKALYMAQPAVSLAISELEEHYGTRLFERLSRRLYLTEAGLRMREYASPVVSPFHEMEQSLGGWDVSGVLHVGASITIGSQLMPGYVSAFRELRPEMDVRVTIGTSEQLERRLLYNQMDFALLERSIHSPSLVGERYMEDSLTVLCGAGAPFREGQVLTPEEFAAQRFLLREPGSGTRELFDSAMEAAGITVTPAWEAMSTTALINAAIQGLGLAVVSRRLAEGYLARGQVKTLRLAGVDFRRSFRVVYHKDKFLTPAARDFIQLCREAGKAAGPQPSPGPAAP